MSSTIKDIAKKAGVSYSTVSRALNDYPEVNKQTKKKILKIAMEMQYQPNALARGLVKKETKTIGLLIPDITNPFYPELAKGVEDAANEAGYSIFLCNTNWSEKREENYLAVLQQKHIDGLIMSPSSDATEHLQYISSSGLKVVFIDSKIQIVNCTSIIINNARGGQMATEHLIQKGHKDIAFIGGQQDNFPTQERLKGYRSALNDFNIQINKNHIQFGNYSRESGYNIMCYLLKSDKKPTAVFAANDVIALGVIQAIKKFELSIPSDIAVVGFDGIEYASLPEIQLSTISQPIYEMGKISLNTLINQLSKNEQTISQLIMLEPELIIRGTS